MFDQTMLKLIMIKKALISWFLNTKINRWFMGKILPYLRFSMYYTKISGKQYHAGYELLRPGHIILTTDKKKLTTMLIPGEWSHAALCVGKYPEKFEVCEMTHLNFHKTHFFDLCKEADRVRILECPDFSAKYVQEMIDKCISFENALYDVEFELGIEALYCSELVYQSDFKRVLQVDLSDIAGLNQLYISPDGINAAKNVKLVWDSDSVK